MTNKLQSLISEIENEFDKEFTKEGGYFGWKEIYPQDVKNFYRSKLKQVLEEIIKAAPEEKIPNYQLGGRYEQDEAFNQGRAQTLQVITELINNLNEKDKIIRT